MTAMQYKFFESQWDRLKGVYSHGSLSEERKRLMWEQVRNVPEKSFEASVSAVIREQTGQQLPAMSKFMEQMGAFKTSVGASMQVFENPFDCEPCRDFGYGFIGDTVVKCTCAKGNRISPTELALQQKHYDVGRKLFPMPGMGKPKISSAFSSLPYDPKTSVAETDGEVFR